MWGRIFITFLLLLLNAGIASSDELPPVSLDVHEFWVTRYTESGVTDRLAFEYRGDITLTRLIDLRLGFGVAPFEQIEASLWGVELVQAIEILNSRITLGIQQEKWHNWRVIENRAELYWTVEPADALTLTLGVAARAPMFDRTSFFPEPRWSNDAVELCPLYRLDMGILDENRFSLRFVLANYDRMFLYTPSNIHFIFKPEWELSDELSVIGNFSLAIKGLSGLVLSYSQFTTGIGLSYAL
jgi:hypothetical protein